MNPEATIATRASLLVRLKDHEDQASWQEFFDTYWRLIYSVATRAGLNDAEAQDVVQETVISVANKVAGFTYDPNVCSFKSWMLRLTRWRIVDRIRRREREAAALGHRIHAHQPSSAATGLASTEEAADRTATLDHLADPAGSELDRVWEEEWRETTFRAALEALRQRIEPGQYQIFDLYAVKRLPVGQVARMTGASVARVYLTRHRVAALLKREVLRIEAEGPARFAGSGRA